MFSKRFTLFRLLGFEVKIDLTWLLLALLVTWTLAKGVFPNYFPELSARTYWVMGIAGTSGLLVSIVFHELCHSLVARRYGLPIEGITLFIFGGVAEMTDEPPSPKAEFLMAAAGPLASFALAFAFYWASITIAEGGWSPSVTGVLFYLAYLNGLLAIFNLIPAFPLDGGRMLRAALWYWKGDIRWSTRLSSSIGSAFGLALIALAVLAVLQGNFIVGMWWFLIGTFIRTAAGMSYHQLLMREILRREPVSRFLNAAPVTVPTAISLQQLVDDYVYKYQFKMFPVTENSKLVGCVTTREVKSVPREDWTRRTVHEVFKPCSPENTIAPDVEALDALSLMTRTGSSRLMVVDKGTLVGIVALKDLLRFLSLKLELEEPAV
jgi:Zn-dependent protease